MKYFKWILPAILIIAFFLNMLVIMPSGSHFCSGSKCGIFFWGAHEHDGVWHLALINSAFSSWPAKFPTFAGSMLSGYNALLDVVIRVINYVTKIPSSIIYFKIIPIIWFGSMILVWNKFGSTFSKSKWYLSSLFFFIFFGNSFSYIFRLFHEGTIWGASGILSMQSPQMLNNIQFALTLPLLGLLLIIFKKDDLSWKENLWIGFLNFVIMGLKFYGGVVAMAMSLCFAITFLFKRNWKDGIFAGITAIIGFGLATILFYNPFDATTYSAILTWQPMTAVHPIIEEIGLFYTPDIANLRNNLYAGGGGIRLILIEMVTLLIFILFNWGTRIIGIFSMKHRPFDFVLMTGILTGLLMNVFFIQRGEWWNTVQFLYYAMFLSSIYAAQTLANWMDKRKLYLLLALMTIILTIPNSLDTYRIFSSYPPQSYVSDVEVEALTYLKSLPQGVTLALPLGTIPDDAEQVLKHLYNRYDTAYVAAFSGKQTYLNDLVQLRLTGINYADRVSDVASGNCFVLSQVKYIYVAGDQTQIDLWKKCSEYQLSNIYQNGEVSIYGISQQ